MVKLEQNSGGPDLSHSVRLSNGSSSAEATQTNVNNKISHHFKISSVNGNSADKVPVKGVPQECVNGKHFKKLAVNGTSTGHENSNRKQPVKGAVLVNGYSKKTAVNDTPVVDKNLDEKVSAIDGNCDVVSPVEVPVFIGNHKDVGSDTSNSSSTPSESGSCSNVCIPDSLDYENNCDENQHGFIEVVKKKRNRNRQKNHRKKHSSNLPPGLKTEAIRYDKENDKKLHEKRSSPTHLSQKLPTRNFTAIRSSEKSYSSALLNGQTGKTQLKNGVSIAYSDTQKVTTCSTANKSSNNCDLPETCISVGHLPTDAAKSAITNDILVDKCKPNTKAEMTDVSAQTDVLLQNEMPSNQKECLKSAEEVIHKSEKSSSPIDYVEDTDFIGETDESSNAAYSESVASNDSGRGDSEVTYDDQMPYCCEFPKDKVKNLIGKRGSYKHQVERETGARFWVLRQVFIDEETAIIAFTGTGAQIEKAKEFIKRRFRHVSLRQYLGNQNEQGLCSGPPLSDSFAATLPIGTDIMGVVSCIFTPHYFWLQQFGHPALFVLEDLERRMSNHFNTVLDAPGVVNPMEGNVVAVPVFIEGESLRWVRGEIIEILENGNVMARYLDHGGESEIPASEIRPMRHEFLSIPFFAAKCCLYGILPIGGNWSEEACAEFKRLSSNVQHPPIVQVIAIVSEGYFVNMQGYDEETNSRVNVAVSLMQKGLAFFDVTAFQPRMAAYQPPIEQGQ